MKTKVAPFYLGHGVDSKWIKQLMDVQQHNSKQSSLHHHKYERRMWLKVQPYKRNNVIT